MSTLRSLERLTQATTDDAARKTHQDRIRNARASIARDEAALAKAIAERDGLAVRQLTGDLANRRIHLAELLGHGPAINWRAK